MEHKSCFQLQAENPRGTDPLISSSDRYRAVLRSGDRVRVAPPPPDRRAAPADDPGVGAVAHDRLLRHPDPGLAERPLPVALWPTAALRRTPRHRRVPGTPPGAQRG